MACEYCQIRQAADATDGLCRHEREARVPSLSSLQASEEAKALIAELDNVLRCDQLWGIAQKHIDAAFERGRRSLFDEIREYADKQSIKYTGESSDQSA